jgi:glyoxylase-like metal-dependent hydrolase (beta-lactamase superfamily II)
MSGNKNLTRLDEGLYQVKRAQGSNVYLVTEPDLALIDAGFPIDAPYIRGALKELGAGPEDLRLVVATHYHGDHVGTIAALKRGGGLRAAIHAEDAPFATGDVPYDRFKYRVSRTLFYYSLYPLFRYRYFTPDQCLEEGDVIPLLGGLEVLHTPGHSRGSICLYQRERGLLFSGDLVRRERGVLEGPPPRFTPDPRAAAESLVRLAELDFEYLLPGHGDPILGGAGATYRDHLEAGALWPASGQGQGSAA